MPKDNSKRSRRHRSKQPRKERGVQPVGEREMQIQRFKADLGSVVRESNRSNPLRVIIVGDEHLRFVQVGYRSKARHHIGHGWAETVQRVPVVQIPPEMEVDQLALPAWRVGEEKLPLYLQPLNKQHFRNEKIYPQTISSYLARRAAQNASRVVARRLPSPHIIVVVGGLNDIDRSSYRLGVSIQPWQKENFLKSSLAGIEEIRNDLDHVDEGKEQKSLVLWAGIGVDESVPKEMKTFHRYLDDKIGSKTFDWPKWLHYKCFVGSEMRGASWNHDQAQASLSGVIRYILSGGRE